MTSEVKDERHICEHRLVRSLLSDDRPEFVPHLRWSGTHLGAAAQPACQPHASSTRNAGCRRREREWRGMDADRAA